VNSGNAPTLINIMPSSNPKPSKRERRLEAVLDELTNCVGWNVLAALDAREIKHSYSDLAKIYNKAKRLLKQT